MSNKTIDTVLRSKEQVEKKGKYKLGLRSVFTPHNKNGKLVFTTTLTLENYEWLTEKSKATQTSGSAILNQLLDEQRKK